MFNAPNAPDPVIPVQGEDPAEAARRAIREAPQRRSRRVLVIDPSSGLSVDQPVGTAAGLGITGGNAGRYQ